MNTNVESIVKFRTDKYQEIQNKLTEYSDITAPLSGQVLKISTLITELKAKVDGVKKNDGTLRIGIVGQVKAGKSSFLNAILFDGENILPKASTPMTAALTLIAYSEKPYAEVEFYTKDDWEIIANSAREYDKVFREVKDEFEKKEKKILLKIKKGLQSKPALTEGIILEEVKKRVNDEILAANDLFKQAKIKKIPLDEYLDRTKTISDISSIEDLMGKLEDYVGADGKFTPFTRNTKLYLNIPSLKGVELVDTPGVNDPIVSRVVITRKFLSQCDCVFLLSYAGQFMGQEDTSFLVDTLPNEGIRKIILIGSKFDSVLFDEAKKYNGNLIQAMKEVREKLVSQANEAVLPVIEDNAQIPVMAALKKSLPPKFISGICYNIAKKDPKDLDSMESHVLKQLQFWFPDFEFTKEILFDLANIDNIKNAQISEIKNETMEILKNRLGDLIDGQNREFITQVTHIIKDLKSELSNIQNSNIEDLEDSYKNTQSAIKEAENDIKQFFIDLCRDIKIKIRDTIKDTQSQKRGNSKLQIDEESKSYTSGWWIFKKTHYYTESYAKVHDAVEAIITYVDKTNCIIKNQWKNLVDLEDMERKLISLVLRCMDTSNERYDKNDVIRPLKNAMADILIEPFDVESEKYEKKIRQSFSGKIVTGDNDTEELQATLRNLINEIFTEIKTGIEQQKKGLLETLNSKGNSFSNDIIKKANERTDELKKQVKEQRYYETRYNSLIDALTITLKEIEGH